MEQSKTMWNIFLPILVTFLKDKKAEMEKEGLIPTLELLIADLEADIEISKIEKEF